MSQYKGKKVRVDATPAEISERFSDLQVFGEKLDSIPAEQRQKLGDLSFEKDAIKIKNPAVGEFKFRVVENTPSHIAFKADGMLPMMLNIELAGVEGDTKTDVQTIIDIELPMMLRPLLGGKLQQVADSFGDFIGKLSAAK